MSRYWSSLSRSFSTTARVRIRRPSIPAITASRPALNSSIRVVLNSIICVNMATSQLRFENNIERGLRDSAQRGETGGVDGFPQPGFAGLRAECRANILGQRARCAEQGREPVVGGADRIGVVSNVVVG